MGLKYSRSYISIALHLAITVLIGFGIIILSLDKIECGIVLNLQSFAKKYLGIPFFKVLTYLGDFYLWTVFSTVFFFYAYFISRKNLSISLELMVYIILVTASTYLLKTTFSRPRPDCDDIIVYTPEAFFSYPSGHVSRATGALLKLSKKSAFRTILIITAISSLSLSRIVLGIHFPTDTLGAIFLSLAVYKITEIITHSFFKSP